MVVIWDSMQIERGISVNDKSLVLFILLQLQDGGQETSASPAIPGTGKSKVRFLLQT